MVVRNEFTISVVQGSPTHILHQRREALCSTRGPDEKRLYKYYSVSART